jgi:hypothetical protein
VLIQPRNECAEPLNQEQWGDVVGVVTPREYLSISKGKTIDLDPMRSNGEDGSGRSQS